LLWPRSTSAWPTPWSTRSRRRCYGRPKRPPWAAERRNNASVVGDGGELPQLRELVARLDAPHGAGEGAHDQRAGRRPHAAVVHAPQQLTVGDAGGGEEAVVAAHQVVGVQDQVE